MTDVFTAKRLEFKQSLFSQFTDGFLERQLNEESRTYNESGTCLGIISIVWSNQKTPQHILKNRIFKQVISLPEISKSTSGSTSTLGTPAL